MNKEVSIGSILTEYNFDRKSFDEAKLELLKLCDDPSEFQDRKLKDILNWVKSDLAQEATPKLARTQTPYRIEKLRFLRKLEGMLSLVYVAETIITLDQSIVFLEKALGTIVEFEMGEDEKTEFILDIVTEYKKQLITYGIKK